jgi:hypothetical protein
MVARPMFFRGRMAALLRIPTLLAVGRRRLVVLLVSCCLCIAYADALADRAAGSEV